MKAPLVAIVWLALATSVWAGNVNPSRGGDSGGGTTITSCTGDLGSCTQTGAVLAAQVISGGNIASGTIPNAALMTAALTAASTLDTTKLSSAAMPTGVTGSPTLAVTNFTGALPAALTGAPAIALTNVTGAIPSAVTATTQSAGDSSTKLATTAFVANIAAGINPAVAVQEATAAVLPQAPAYLNGVAGVGATLISTSFSALVVDGVTASVGDRVLVKNQASSLQNGVYVVTVAGSGAAFYTLTRSLDYDQPSDMNSTGAIPVINGTANAGTSWVQSSQVVTIGTDPVTFTQFAYALANQATAGANSNITSLTGLTTPLTVPQGGTGVATGTAHGLALWEGASAMAAMALCGTGSFPFGQAAADPICSTLLLPNSAATDSVLTATATNTITAAALTSCSAASSAVTYNTTTHAWGCNTISGASSFITAMASAGAMTNFGGL